MTYRAALLAWKRAYFMALLWEHQGSVPEVAKVAGTNKKSLYLIMKRLGIKYEEKRLTNRLILERRPDGSMVVAETKKRANRGNRGNSAWQSLGK